MDEHNSVAANTRGRKRKREQSLPVSTTTTPEKKKKKTITKKEEKEKGKEEEVVKQQEEGITTVVKKPDIVEEIQKKADEIYLEVLLRKGEIYRYRESVGNKHPYGVPLTLIQRVVVSTRISMALKDAILQILEGEMLEKFDQSKYHQWVSEVLRIPTVVKSPGIDVSDPSKIKEALVDAKLLLDEGTYGQESIKNEFIDFIALTLQARKKTLESTTAIAPGTMTITETKPRMVFDAEDGEKPPPHGTGNVIALVGSPGTGKTKLVRDGLAAALGLPFYQISMGGLHDVHTLTGFDRTYAGSKMGRIAEIILQSQCLNPVIYLDEIDKIGSLDGTKAMEVYGLLTHLLDPQQNCHFVDEYLGQMAPLDLSHVLFVVAMNNVNAVDAIVKDRIKLMNIPSPTKKEKIEIMKKFVIPELCKRMGRGNGEEFVFITDKVLEYILNRHCPKEEGVRQFRRVLETLLQKANTMDIMGEITGKEEGGQKRIIIIDERFVDKLLQSEVHMGNPSMPSYIMESMYN